MFSLRKFAEKNGITYVTAHRHWVKGNIDGLQLPTGKILVSGWKKDSADTDKVNAVVFIRVPKGGDPSSIRTKLHEFANLNKITIEKEIVWEAYMFQSNPFLGELLSSGYKYILASSMSDIYGSNHAFIENIFKSNGISTMSLSDPKNIASIIYRAVSAASKMAKATVGMSGYKKEIAESHNDLLT